MEPGGSTPSSGWSLYPVPYHHPTQMVKNQDEDWVRMVGGPGRGRPPEEGAHPICSIPGEHP
jgi:hypothetical protein